MIQNYNNDYDNDDTKYPTIAMTYLKEIYYFTSLDVLV